MTAFPLLGLSDPFSSMTHLFGALGCVGLARPLIRRATRVSGGGHYVGVFAATAVFLLTMSGCFHGLPHGSPARDILQRLDHAGIFILIAGTFTAGHGLFFRGFWRWGMIALIWTVGIAGLVAKLVYFDDISEGVGLGLYLSMGWLGAVAMVKLVLDRDLRAAGYLFAGGLVYTLGAVGEFFGGESLTLVPGVIGAHELFHVAVLGGLAVHWRLFHSSANLEIATQPA